MEEGGGVRRGKAERQGGGKGSSSSRSQQGSLGQPPAHVAPPASSWVLTRASRSSCSRGSRFSAHTECPDLIKATGAAGR